MFSTPSRPFLKDYIYLFLERRKKKEKERETNIDVWEKHLLVAYHTHPDQGPGLQPRHVPWLGIKLVNFGFAGQCPTNWVSHTGQGSKSYLDSTFTKSLFNLKLLPDFSPNFTFLLLLPLIKVYIYIFYVCIYTYIHTPPSLFLPKWPFVHIRTPWM